MTVEQRKQILIETVKMFGRQEWFRDAAVYDAHPASGQPTLEIKVNYVPVLKRKEVMDFAQKMGLHERFTVVDKNGKAVD